MDKVEDTIFKNGSATYYWSSQLFPREVRHDVLRLYSFLRVADDYVDARPAQPHHFALLHRAWDHAKNDPHFISAPEPDDTVDERVIKNIVGLTRTHGFDIAWVEAFWNAMQADLDAAQYQELDDVLGYVHGSAEVVGLMMVKIMGLTPASYQTAMLQGRAMQWINFIRDIQEDTEMGRCYFPRADFSDCGLVSLNEAEARKNPAAFRRLVRLELNRYKSWQNEARQGFGFVPGLLRPALKTAVDMYDWTAAQIAKDPFIVLERQVKPAKSQVFLRGIRNLAP
ncbi:MAG TPA: phytoene/squalene synthase family protein [Candidatus Saccharimonadales bacterium]|nr:phytoene/squalene synthase family protein [Candidatus Saccharimonadales bacterium]